MAFPTTLTNAVDGVTPIVAAHLNNLEAKVGVDGSSVPTSLDYLIKNPSSIEPGHKHNKLWASDGSSQTVTVNATNVLSIVSGTAPSTAPEDLAQMWVEDVGGQSGKAGLHMMAESGTNKLVVVGVILKNTTGDPTQVHEGLMCINTYDKTLKMVCGGSWRQLISWT